MVRTDLKKIITHSGQAHVDEIMACSLIYYLENKIVPILRVDEPTDLELNDPEIAVLDIGAKYEPLKMNYDHHQLKLWDDKGGIVDTDAIQCTLSMLVRDTDRNLYSYLDVGEYGQPTWFRALRYVDQLGVFEASGRIGSTITLSFLQTTAPAMFMVNPEGCASLLAPFWETIMTEYEEYLPKMKKIRAQDIVVYHEELGGWAFIDTKSKNLALVERAYHWVDKPEVVVMRDDKGPGYYIHNRIRGKHINFYRCQGDSRLVDVKKHTVRTLANITEADIREIIFKGRSHE